LLLSRIYFIQDYNKSSILRHCERLSNVQYRLCNLRVAIQLNNFISLDSVIWIATPNLHCSCWRT